ncbi:MAG TPA: hypothetical protein ENI62_15750 [Gammaproteobacteria bacterium]|nr:hypothetical protein [Gammaproteobacteria bacterium]
MNFPALLCTLCLLLFGVSSPAVAGYFDCSVVYDEYDSLMQRQFLVEPDRYVTTLRDNFSFEQFFSMQRGLLHLNERHRGQGVAIVHTNRNASGKFLFTWERNDSTTDPVLTLQELVLYGRVADGLDPILLGPILLKPNTELDLDTGKTMDQSNDSDLVYQISAQGVAVLSAIHGAKIDLPIESLCHNPVDKQALPTPTGRVNPIPTAPATVPAAGESTVPPAN